MALSNNLFWGTNTSTLQMNPYGTTTGSNTQWVNFGQISYVAEGVSSDEGPKSKADPDAKFAWKNQELAARQRIRSLLKWHPDRIYTTREIYMGLGLRYNAIRKATLLLERDHEIVRDSYGRGVRDRFRWGQELIRPRKKFPPLELQKPRTGTSTPKQRKLMVAIAHERNIHPWLVEWVEKQGSNWHLSNADAHGIICALKTTELKYKATGEPTLDLVLPGYTPGAPPQEHGCKVCPPQYLCLHTEPILDFAPLPYVPVMGSAGSDAVLMNASNVIMEMPNNYSISSGKLGPDGKYYWSE